MSDGAGDGESCGPQGGEPGALSRLLDELARAPHADPASAWGKALRPGDVLDRFEILRELGRGGFGAVYEALDRELGRKVALKTLRPGRSRDEWSDEALRREAQAAASLSHPGIVTLHEACTCDRGPYLVMELLKGETLESRLARGPLPLAEAVEAGLQMARALAHVHGHGLVHRDLKPGNVHLGEDGRVKLLDLGLAHLLGRKSSTGGTPAYVAPEQWRGEEVDGRADVFALGAVLFEMVSGRRPFEVKEERSSALDQGPAPALSGKVPRGLARLVARCLTKEASGRPTAAQAAEELLAIQRGQARPRAMRRIGLVLGAGAAVGIAVALVALQSRSKGGGTSPDGRVVVAVADVVNETGEKELDVLSGLLVTSLEQSRKLSVMTQARVLDLAIRAGRKDAARVDETIGREVGAAHGVRALLLPAIRKLGTTYSLEMRAIDPGRDRHLFTLSDRATSKEALLDLLDRLSERTRTELGEPRDEVGKASVQLGEAMTRSLDAYQHYLAGLEAWRRDGLRAVGLREFEEALRLDPGFAAAHGEMANLLLAYGMDELAMPHWRAAGENLDRMPEREQLLLRLDRAQSLSAPEVRSPGEIRRVASMLEERFPDDRHVLLRTAEALLDPDIRSETRTVAERVARKALALGPGDCGASGLLEWMLGDRPAELLENARRAVTSRRSACNLVLLARAELATDSASAGMTAREALRLDGVSNASIVRDACGVLDALTRRPACKAEWRRLLDGGANEMERDFARFQLAAALAVEGRRREARRLLFSVPVARRGAPADVARVLAIGVPVATGTPTEAIGPPASSVLLEARADVLAAVRRESNKLLRRYLLHMYGALDEADALTADLPSEDRFEFAERLYEPLRLARQGRYLEAAEAQRRARDQALVDEGDQSAYWMAYLLGELLLAAGRPEEAAAVEVRHPRRGAFYLVGYAAHDRRLALVRARALEQLGRRADAIRELDGVLAFWKEADPDLPLLVEAKAMRKRLAAQPAAGKAVKVPAPAATKAEASTPSIAVLPFADLSPGKDQEYFADGVAEEILNALAQVDGLHVAGRTSSFSFKGKQATVEQIGRALRVGTLLEGSVRKDGNQVRVTARIVTAATGFRLWAQTFDRELTGVFAVQEEIAQAVVAALRVKLLPGKTRPIRDVRTGNPEVYRLYLLGRDLSRRGTLDEWKRALAAHEQALALDPEYAPAWAGVASTLAAIEGMGGQGTAPAQRKRALEAADRAIALAPDLPDGYWVRAMIRMGFHFDWRGADADLKRARALGPSDADVATQSGQLLLNLGRFSEAIEVLREATALDPLSAFAWDRLGLAYTFAGDLDRGREALLRSLDVAPGGVMTLILIMNLVPAGRSADALAVARRCDLEWVRSTGEALALKDLGRSEEARAALERLIARNAGDAAYQIAEVYAWQGEPGKAFEWLERAYAQRDPGLQYTRSDHLLRPLHADPRWKPFLHRLNFPVD